MRCLCLTSYYFSSVSSRLPACDVSSCMAILSCARDEYRMYSNKRRIWDKKVNNRHGLVAALIWGFSYDLRKGEWEPSWAKTPLVKQLKTHKVAEGGNNAFNLLVSVNFSRPNINCAALDKSPHLRREKFNKRRGAYYSKYGNQREIMDFS